MHERIQQPVQDLAELRLRPTNDVQDKAVIFVEDEETFFYFDFQGVGVDDGVDIIEPTAGPGRWFRNAGGGGGGGGGPDTYTAPNEYFVDPTLAVDATKRQYQTIGAALLAAAGDSPVIVRLAENQTHPWDGTGLTALGADVYIYSTNPPDLTDSSKTTVSFSNPTTLSSNFALSFQNVQFDGDTNVTVGVQILLLERCFGIWNVTGTDTPTGHVKQWTFSNCSFADLNVIMGAGDTNGGVWLVNDCILSNAYGSVLWNHVSGTELWYAYFNKTTVNVLDTAGSALFEATGSSGDLIVSATACTFIVYADADTITLKGGGSGTVWECCRIAEGLVLGKSGLGFRFGGDDPGAAIDLTVSVTEAARLPIDGPDGIEGRVSAYGGGSGWSFGQFTFSADTAQWRGQNNVAHLSGLIGVGDTGLQVPLSTIAEGDAFINLSPPTSKGVFSLRGRVIADSNFSDESAIWDTEIFVRCDGSPVTTTFLMGVAPTIVYEDNPGQFTLLVSHGGAFSVVNFPVTGTLTINGVVLTAVAGARTPGSDDFDGSLATAALIAAEIVEAINDPANSFASVAIAQVSEQDPEKVCIVSVTTATLTLAETSAQIVLSSNIGVSYSVIRNSGAATSTHLTASVQVLDGRFFT